MKRLSRSALGLLLISLPLTTHADFPACPASSDWHELEQWRKQASTVQGHGDPAASVVRAIETCFPGGTPRCLVRLEGYYRNLVYDSGTPAELSDEEKKMAEFPEEFRLPDGRFSLTLRDASGRPKDIEQFAREKGWLIARYKSRHSGGFDGNTASLLMIRVPGASRVPPVGFDQYINIALPPEPGEAQKATKDVEPMPKVKIPTPEEYEADTRYNFPSVVTIVAATKKTADRPSHVVFAKFNREGSKFSGGRENTTGCYSCHPNGLRAISPLGYGISEDERRRGQTLPPEMWKAVREMNNSMTSLMGYSMPVIGDAYKDGRGKLRHYTEPESYGPVYGPVKPLNRREVVNADGTKTLVFPTRTKEFIVGADGKSGCARSVLEIDMRDIFDRAAGRDNKYTFTASPPIDWQKVKNAMSCASCHNNQIRGALNSRTDSSALWYKILVDKTMPVGAHHNPLDQGSSPATPVHDDLNPNERIALVNCLREEYAQESELNAKWIEQVSCAANQNVAAPAKPVPDPMGSALRTVSPGAGAVPAAAPAESISTTRVPVNGRDIPAGVHSASPGAPVSGQ